MPTTACNINHPMLLPGQALAHNQIYLQHLYCMAGTPTVSGPSLKFPRDAYTVLTGKCPH